MGIVIRKYNKEMMDLHKKYKHSIEKVALTMSQGFTDDEFYEVFKRLQPVSFREINDKYISYHELDKARQKKGRRLRNFPSPKKFILLEASNIIRKVRNQQSHGNYNENEATRIKHELEVKASKKIEKYNSKENKDLYYIQEVNPSYTSKLIQIYYEDRKKNSLNVNNRLAIIQEAAKFKSKETIKFLKQVQSGEKNEDLRLAAYYALRQIHAPDVKLHKKRKGKKKMNQIIKPEEHKTPQELLASIYNADFEDIKEYDVFISHSSQNIDRVHSFVKALNNNKYVCYVDWIADRQQLKRQLTSKETAEVIINRIKQSKIFVYVLTKECIASKWSPWELGFAYAKGKPICIFQLENIEHKPEYLDLHDIYTDLEDVVSFIKNHKTR